MSHYQLCPKCQGQGIVSRPPWVPADQLTWCSTQTSHVCDVCHGAKVLLVSACCGAETTKEFNGEKDTHDI